MSFPIICRKCGEVYSEWRWRRETEFCGFQEDEVERLELRTCRCGSTHSVPVAKQTEIDIDKNGRAELLVRLVSDVEPLLSHERDVR